MAESKVECDGGGGDGTQPLLGDEETGGPRSLRLEGTRQPAGHPADRRIKEIEDLALEGGNAWQLWRKLVWMELPFWMEIVLFLTLAYYLDVGLDSFAIGIWISKEQYKYMCLNIFAIVAANIYSYVDMRRVICNEKDPHALRYLTLGYLTPWQVHMAVLCWISLRDRKRHPLMFSIKLAEAALEAFIASLVQTYALIYTEWEESSWQWVIMCASVTSSFFVIGYSMMKFDSREVGLRGVPGKMPEGPSPEKVLVLAVRIAEVASRITSLAIFSVCTRQAWRSEIAGERAGVLAETFLLNLGPPLVLVDLLVLSGLILCSKGKLYNALPSVLCFVNPLLELGNPLTMRAPVYYGWRCLELLFMGAYLLTDHEFHDKLDSRLMHHRFIKWGCVASTVTWLLLLPLVRFKYAKHALIEWYDLEMFGSKPFDEGQQKMLNDLVDSNGGTMKMKAEQILKEGVDKLNNSVERNMPKRIRDCSQRVDARHSWVYEWAQRVLRDHHRKLAEKLSPEEIFRVLLTAGANLAPTGCLDKQVLLEVLQALSNAMQVNNTVKKRAYSHLKQLPRILKWQWEDDKVDMDLHEEKLKIIATVGERGWEVAQFQFLEKEAGALMQLLDTHVPGRSESGLTVSTEHWEGFAAMQMRALLRIWRSIPPMSEEEELRYSGDLAQLFRGEVEWEAMAKGAQVMLKNLGKMSSEEPIWNNHDLLQFCRARQDARRMFETMQEQEEVQNAVRQEVEAMIDKRRDAFDAAMNDAPMQPPAWTALEELKKDLGWIIEHEDLFRWMGSGSKSMTQRCTELIEQKEKKHGDQIAGLRVVSELALTRGCSLEELHQAESEIKSLIRRAKTYPPQARPLLELHDGAYKDGAVA